MAEENEKKGQDQVNGKCKCMRCGKTLSSANFYTYKDGTKCEICKACLTAHIDNFNPQTFVWILQRMDVPYVPAEWNVLRDRAFAKDPYGMTGMSVIGKYLAKMRLKKWQEYGYKDSERILQEEIARLQEQQATRELQKKTYEAELKVKLSEGAISEAQYKTLVSTETQNQDLPPMQADLITGEHQAVNIKKQRLRNTTEPPPLLQPAPQQPTSYEQALSQARNPFQEKNFLSESEIIDPGSRLNDDDKLYLALKWGRLYTPSQWIALEQLYTQFMNSFDIQGAARIDTLKKICKVSLKMDQAIDGGDTDGFTKLSRSYDTLMKSAKFTEAQNKDKEGDNIDSASAIVDYVETHSGSIPRYRCDEPQDVVDKIIYDLKAYTKNLIYEDKSLAQEIEKYLKNKTISAEMRKDKQQAREEGKDQRELTPKDIYDYREIQEDMLLHDHSLSDQSVEQEYLQRRVRADGNK